MRIAYVINSVEGGGASAPVPAVCRVLRAHGAHVEIFALTGRDRRGQPAMTAAGFDVHVRPGGDKDHDAALQWLNARLKRWRPDVIWTSLTRATLLGQIIGQRQRLPVVSWQHAAYLKVANRLLLRMRQSRSAFWIADSECVAALTRKRLAVDEGRLITWPLFAANGDAPVAEEWRPRQTLRIGSLGRLHRVKGYDTLIEAIKLLKKSNFQPSLNWELLIAGEGSERAALQTAIDSAGIDNVKLVGFTKRPQQFLTDLHLYVQPSRSEGFCIAAHEAMLAGLPVIGTRVGEMQHSIEPRRSGWIVDPEDASGLAHALADSLATPERLRAMGLNARQTVLDKFGRSAFEATGAAIMQRVSALASR
jgi:glycosyltransferase involved in cell wall biosynthesis